MSRTKKILSSVALGGLNLLVAATVAGIGGLAYLYSQLPDVASLTQVQLSQPLKVYDVKGRYLTSYGDETRIPLQYNQIPKTLRNALIATKDRDFESDAVEASFIQGYFNPHTVLSAEGKILQQGPNFAQTLAMQYWDDEHIPIDLTRTKDRLKNLLLAYKISHDLSREEIITLLINKLDLGTDVYGFEAGAQAYFAKSVGDLSTAEMASLVAISLNPDAFDLYGDTKQFAKLRNVVIKAMGDAGLIDAEHVAKAIAEPVQFKSGYLEDGKTHLTDLARQAMVQRFGEAAFLNGYKVYLTIDKGDQDSAEVRLRTNLLANERKYEFGGISGRSWPEGSRKVPDRDAIARSLNHFAVLPPIFPVVVLSSDADGVTVLNANGVEKKLGASVFEYAMGLPSPEELKRLKDDFDNELKIWKADRSKDKGPEPVWEPPKPKRQLAGLFSPGDVIYLEVVPEAPQYNRVSEITVAESKFDPLVDVKPQHLRVASIPETQGAFVSLNAKTGAVQTLVGGFYYHPDDADFAVDQVYKMGSQVKPFLFTSAFLQDKTPSLGGLSTPVSQLSIDGQIEDIINFNDERSPKEINFRTAMGRNLNTAAVEVSGRVGERGFLNFLRLFGFQPDFVEGAVALGQVKSSPLQVARAYSVIANGGYLVNPYLVQKITDSADQVVFQANKPEVCPSCKPTNVYELTYGNQKQSDDTAVGNNAIIHQAVSSTVVDIEITQQAGQLVAPRVLPEFAAYMINDGLKSNLQGNKYFKSQAPEVKAVAAKAKREDIGVMVGPNYDEPVGWAAGFTGAYASAVLIADPRQQATPAEPANDLVNRAVDTMAVYTAELVKHEPAFTIAKPNNLVTRRIDDASFDDRNGYPELFVKGSYKEVVVQQEPEPAPAPKVEAKVTKQAAPAAKPAPKQTKTTNRQQPARTTQKAAKPTQAKAPPPPPKPNKQYKNGRFNDDEFGFYDQARKVGSWCS